jgi:hypothetical protein
VLLGQNYRVNNCFWVDLCKKWNIYPKQIYQKPKKTQDIMLKFGFLGASDLVKPSNQICYDNLLGSAGGVYVNLKIPFNDYTENVRTSHSYYKFIILLHKFDLIPS